MLRLGVHACKACIAGRKQARVLFATQGACAPDGGAMLPGRAELDVSNQHHSTLHGYE
jgi:hypothetical protein